MKWSADNIKKFHQLFFEKLDNQIIEQDETVDKQVDGR